MRNILYLMIKDIRLLWKQLLLGTILGVLSAMSTVYMSLFAFPAIMIMLGYLTDMQSFYIEEKNDSFLLLGTLPLRTDHIILAKYLLFFVSAGCALVVYVLFVSIARLLGAAGMAPELFFTIQVDWIGILLGLSVGAVFTSLMIPLIAKWGVMKARYGLMAIFMISYFSLMSLAGIASSANDAASGEAALSSLLSLFDARYLFNFVLLFAASMLIRFLSYRLTCSIYAKKRTLGT